MMHCPVAELLCLHLSCLVLGLAYMAATGLDGVTGLLYLSA